MRLRIAVTDNDWFRYLRSQPDLDEVNFWQPGGERAFHALEPDELLLFKLHHPHNYIVGGGFFVRFLFLPWTFAWDAFGSKNGAPTLSEMKKRIEKYRRKPVGPADPIGCILLRQPFFFDELLWIPAPEDFARNIVQGKNYGPDTAAGRALWEQVSARLLASAGEVAAPAIEEPAMWGDPVLVRPRLGQGTFRVLVTDNYQRRCAGSVALAPVVALATFSSADADVPIPRFSDFEQPSSCCA